MPAGGQTTAAPATPAARPPVASALGALNDRLRAVIPGPTGTYGGLKRVDAGGYTTQRVLDEYEAALAPPLEILAKTFGLIRVRRTLAQADSIAYVYERRKSLFGQDVCRAYRIVEHPLRPVEKGPVLFPGPLPPLKPIVETVDVSCNDPKMQAIEPGSLTTPAPRHVP